MAEQADDFINNPPQLNNLPDLGSLPSLPEMDFSIPKLEVPKFEFPAAPKLDIPKIETPETATPFPSSFKKEKTVGGFIGNFVSDASDTLKNLGHFLVVDVPSALVVNPARAAIGGAFDTDKAWREKYLKDWSERIDRWSKDPSGQAIEGGGMLLHALADPYWDFKNDHFKWDFWYERPFTVLADAATLASLGAGTAGKAANVAGRATRVGEGLAKAADIMSKSEKILNPISWVTTGAKTLAAPALESLGIGKHSPGLTKIVAETRAEAAAERGVLEGVSAEERSAMANLEEVRPVPGGIKTEGTPGGLEITETTPQIFKYEHKPAERGLEEVTVKPIGPLTPEEAADLLKQANDKMKRRVEIKGNINDIENGKLPDTPTMNARVADTFTDLKWRKIAADRINQYLVDNKIISPIEVGNYEKINLQGLSQAYDVTLGSLEEFKVARETALKNGASEAEALKAGSAAAKSYAERLKDVSFGKDVWVPKHVSRFLQHEFFPPDLQRLTDVYKLWQPAVTSLRFPSYHLQVLVGNTIMSLLYGVNPITEWALTKKLRTQNAFPAELAENTGARWIEELSNGEGAFNKVSKAYLDAAQKVGGILGTSGSDARLRQEIAIHYISKQLKDGILGSVPTHEALVNGLKEVLGSKDALRNVLEEVKKARLSETEAGILAERSASNVRPSPIEWQDVRPPKAPGAPGRRTPILEEVKMAPVTPELEELLPSTTGKRTTQPPELLGGKRMPEGAATPNEGRRKSRPILGKEQAFNDAQILAEKTAIRETLEAQVPDFQKKVEILNKAIEEGNRWAGNVLALHPFERSVLKKIIPFYSYTKAMTALAFEAAIIYPKRMFMLNRIAKLTADIMHDPDAPEWVQEYVPFGFDSDGNIMAIRLGSLNPFSGVRGTEFGDQPLPGMLDPTRNPIIKLVYEAAGGTPQWSKRPLKPGEYAARMSDGSIYEYQKDGTFKRVLAQPSIVKSVAYMFPQIQALDELLTPYVTRDTGKLGILSDPILGPDGKPRFPKELWTRLLGVLPPGGMLPTTSYKEQEQKDMMRKQTGSIMKEFAKALRNPSLTQEQRQSLIDSLRDAAEAEHKRIIR